MVGLVFVMDVYQVRKRRGRCKVGNLSKTARKSGIKTPGVKDPFDTNEKKIKELRKSKTTGLSIRPDFVDALLEEYDKLISAQEKGKDVVTTREPSPSEILQADLEPLPEITEAIDYRKSGMVDHGGEG
jgi:hypothetical protein